MKQPFPFTDQPLFDATFFTANRNRLRELVEPGMPIVVTANGTLQRNSDTTYPFRQDSNFWYLTGSNAADAILVMDGAEDYIFVPGRDQIHAVFDGQVDHDQLSEQSGVAEILGAEEGWRRLDKRLAACKKAATPLANDAYIDGAAFYTNPARQRLAGRLREQVKKIQLVDIRPQLASLRAVKAAPEVAAIQRAIDITAASLQAVTEPKALLANTLEREVEADLTRLFRRAGAQHAFSSIVASGARACQLHYVDNNGPLVKNALLVLDIGAEYSNYAADLTRTVAVGKPTARQQAVFDAVCEAQDYALDLLKPGVLYMDYEKQVEAFMGRQLQKLGLVAAGATVPRQDIRRYYPHATSHFLGLDAHDVGDYTQPLTSDMVLTCEPGIYIPEEGIGVRIEDDVILTKDGNQVLSQHLPRRLA